jgi:RNase adapter protein RapZ
MKLLIVSGRSGSGKTIALRVLEDLGYYCVDNLPVSFLPDLLKLSRVEHNLLAVSIDIRNFPESPESFINYINSIKSDPSNEVISIFLDADDNTLIRRYEETRRLHPLAKSTLTLEEAIKAEHNILDSIADLTDVRVDTSTLSIHELSENITSLVLGKKEKKLSIIFESFGFKYGIAKDADFVFDARFLPNPHWVPELRPLTGLDDPVIKFFAEFPEMGQYIQQIDAMLNHWLPYLERNNRSYLTVAIGCTGGQHRSVFIAEALAQRFRNRGKCVNVKHKNINAIKHIN